MKTLTIKRKLNEDTREQSVWAIINCEVEVFSLHVTEDEVIITDHKDYSKIYCIYSSEYYHAHYDL